MKRGRPEEYTERLLLLKIILNEFHIHHWGMSSLAKTLGRKVLFIFKYETGEIVLFKI